MKIGKIAVLMILLVGITGCGHNFHEYAPNSDISGQNTASLTFVTEELNKSRPYALMNYSLQMHIYRGGPDKPAYLGTVKLTHEEKARTIQIPAGERLTLDIKYSSYVLGMISVCKPSLTLTPVQNKSYSVIFQSEGKDCRARISESGNIAPVPQASIQ